MSQSQDTSRVGTLASPLSMSPSKRPRSRIRQFPDEIRDNGDPRKAAVRPRPGGQDIDLTSEVLWLALLCIHRGTSRQLLAAEPDGQRNTYLQHTEREELLSICLLGSKQPGPESRIIKV